MTIHSRSRMAVDPRIPIMPVRSASGFHPSGGEGGNEDHDYSVFHQVARCLWGG